MLNIALIDTGSLMLMVDEIQLQFETSDNKYYLIISHQQLVEFLKYLICFCVEDGSHRTSFFIKI